MRFTYSFSIVLRYGYRNYGGLKLKQLQTYSLIIKIKKRQLLLHLKYSLSTYTNIIYTGLRKTLFSHRIYKQEMTK